MVANLEEAYKLCALYGPNSEVKDSSDQLSYFTGVLDPFANAVVRSVFEQDEAADRIRQTLAYYVDRNVPTMWFVTPASRPSNLGALLVDAGMTARKESPAMVLDMPGRPPIPPIATDVEITEVRTQAEAEVWARAATKGSTVPPEIGDLLVLAANAGGYSNESALRLFVLNKGADAVATSALVTTGDMAGIYCVATLESHRRQGLGAAITSATLAAAWDAGYRVATLQASKMGRGVYERLGFRDVFSIQAYTYNLRD